MDGRMGGWRDERDEDLLGRHVEGDGAQVDLDELINAGDDGEHAWVSREQLSTIYLLISQVIK